MELGVLSGIKNAKNYSESPQFIKNFANHNVEKESLMQGRVSAGWQQGQLQMLAPIKEHIKQRAKIEGFNVIRNLTGNRVDILA